MATGIAQGKSKKSSDTRCLTVTLSDLVEVIKCRDCDVEALHAQGYYSYEEIALEAKCSVTNVRRLMYKGEKAGKVERIKGGAKFYFRAVK